MSAQLLKALFVSTLLVKSCFGVSLSDFYPYGANEGDTFLRPNDDGSSGEVEISVRFPYFDRYHDSLYVSIMENTLFYLLVIWWVVWNAACESFVCVMFVIYIIVSEVTQRQWFNSAFTSHSSMSTWNISSIAISVVKYVELKHHNQNGNIGNFSWQVTHSRELFVLEGYITFT